MKVSVNLDALEHLVMTTYQNADIYDDSRNPDLLDTMIKACEALDEAGSSITFGRYPIRNLREQIAWMKEHL